VGLIKFGGKRQPVLRKQPQGAGAFHHIFEAVAGPSAAPKTAENLAYLVNQSPDLSESVFRAFNLKGELPRYFDPRFGLGATLEDFTRPEFWWLRRGYLMSAGADVASVAAQQSFVSLTGAPNRLTIVEQLRIDSATANAAVVVGLGGAVAAGAASSADLRDDRTGPLTSTISGASIVSGTSAAPVIPGFTFPVRVGPGQTAVLGPFILSGVANLNVICSNVNISLCVSFHWRERELLPTER
jgi:hypothetical protein